MRFGLLGGLGTMSRQAGEGKGASCAVHTHAFWPTVALSLPLQNAQWIPRRESAVAYAIAVSA